MANLELDKTLQVDGQTYEINAVKADKVANSLILTKTLLNGNSETVIDFNGEQGTKNTLEIVPANGGRFNGRITVPSGVSNQTLKADGDTVLSYNDTVSKVVDRLLTTSAMGTWSNGELTFTDTETPAVHGICVVLGNDSDVTSFAESNNENWAKATSENPPNPVPKWLPNYLYICEDSGNIYIGKAESIETKILSSITNDEVIVPKSIEVAPNQWITAGQYGLDMANSDVINLNGLFFADYANLNNEGLNFVQKHPDEHAIDNATIKDPDEAAEIVYDRIYARQGKFYFVPDCTIKDAQQRTPFEVYHSGIVVPIENGGTGADSSREAEYNINGDMELFSDDSDIPSDDTQIVFKYKEPNTEKGVLYTRYIGQLWTYIMNKIRSIFGFSTNNILSEGHGGTGTTSLSNTTVGKANSVKAVYRASVNTSNATIYTNLFILPSEFYPNGPNNGPAPGNVKDGDILILF